ncbi:translesion DNA synthesis-associated protein ImuA [Hahella ganghwensis]|uniref:translesion DNA synthesis-associated protein ImuA n=1 Tax=Hahella ganghwensis TaxID=286420 RepID=UPI00036C8244|nr:translesion DNA synthesis-associated protein ImuA [Hahella ganghwensis]
MADNILDNPAIWRASALHQEQSLNSGRYMLQGIDTGFPLLNEKLADNGWPVDGVIEILHDRQGTGEISILLPALQQLSERDKWLAWIAPPHILHAPALAAAGIHPHRLLIVTPKPGSHATQDCLWCTEEAIKSGAASAVLAWPQQIKPEQVRRLQIIAAQYRTPCFLFRENGATATPCALRIHIRAQDHEWIDVRILKRKRGWPTEPFRLQIRSCPRYRYQKTPLPPALHASAGF